MRARDAQRTGETTTLNNVIGDGIASAGDEVAGDDGEVGAEIIGHIHSAADLGAGHVTAEVNVAELDDLHAIESGRQVGQGNLDAANLIVETLGGETVHGAEKRSGTGRGGGRAEKVAAARGSKGLGSIVPGRRGGLQRESFLCGRGAQPSPKALQRVNQLDCEIGKERAEKPEAGEN